MCDRSARHRLRSAAVSLGIPLLAAAAPAWSQQIANCALFATDSIWNTRIDHLPADPSSAAYIASIGADTALHPDFGSGDWPPGSGAPIGIPYTLAPAAQPPVPVSFVYADESDPGPYPIPPGAAIEGGPEATGDRHVLVVEIGSCTLYELFDAWPNNAGASWAAGSGARFDLGSYGLRPADWTSADAAGLPILPGLVRYEEAAAGAIEHALRFTAPQTRRAWVWPARHHASSLTASHYPPMGQRFRLRADFDLGGYSPRVRVILEALQRYGMMLADNGSAWFISGVPDARWDNDELRQLKQVKGSDFEAVDVSSLMVDADSMQVRPPAECEAPDRVVVTDRAVTGPEEVRACDEIVIGPRVSVFGPSGRLVLVAGERVGFEPEVDVLVDGELVVEVGGVVGPE